MDCFKEDMKSSGLSNENAEDNDASTLRNSGNWLTQVYLKSGHQEGVSVYFIIAFNFSLTCLHYFSLAGTPREMMKQATPLPRHCCNIQKCQNTDENNYIHRYYKIL